MSVPSIQQSAISSVPVFDVIVIGSGMEAGNSNQLAARALRCWY